MITLGKTILIVIAITLIGCQQPATPAPQSPDPASPNATWLDLFGPDNSEDVFRSPE